MIKSFSCKETFRIFEYQYSVRFPSEIQSTALRKLRMIHRAVSIVDLKAPPANRLEKLKGRLAGKWSIRINDQWRICFSWKDGDAFDVEIVDYH